jgi:transposase
VAEDHYQAFKAEVVARVPEAGIVISRTDVAAWLADRSDRMSALRVGRAA